jgi:hypothetical protein
MKQNTGIDEKGYLLEEREGHNPPLALEKWGWRYHHFAIPYNETRSGEMYKGDQDTYTYSFAPSLFGVKWIRFGESYKQSELIKTIPHLCFKVDDLDEAVKGKKILCLPEFPSEEGRTLFIEHDGAPIKLLENPAPGNNPNLRYHHIGIPYDKAMPGEECLEHLHICVHGYDNSPYGIEWIRFLEGWHNRSELVRTVPHVCFQIDNFDQVLKQLDETHGIKPLYEPRSPGEGISVAMIEDNGAPIELISFDESYK